MNGVKLDETQTIILKGSGGCSAHDLAKDAIRLQEFTCIPVQFIHNGKYYSAYIEIKEQKE